jgi:alpha-ketoglutarate-dependent taurine dioxygenase
MRQSQVEIRARGIGGEKGNVDLGRDLEQTTIGEICRALPDHCVIFSRDQEPSARQKAFTRRFGEFACRFRWERGSLASGDNGSRKRRAVYDAGRFHRVMRRTQIKGGPLR